MDTGRKNRTTIMVIAGCIFVAAILILGTILVGRSAQKDTVEAARSVSELYLDELAGRRAQVLEENLNDNIDVINAAVGLLTEDDLQDKVHLQAYQAKMKELFHLERFAFVDEDGLVYTARGMEEDLADYAFDHKTLSGPEISVKNVTGADKKAIIAVPVKDISFRGKKFTVCYMQIDMPVLLQGASMAAQDSGATFCNIYTSEGIALSNTVLGGLAVEDNLLEALAKAEYETGYSYERVAEDFREGNRGTASFTYDGIQETLSYVPVEGTDWLLTYLVRDSLISERIRFVSDGIIRKSLIQSLLAALVLAAMFAFVFRQMRENARLELEKETSETANRVKQQELEQRISLQEQLLAQKEEACTIWSSIRTWAWSTSPAPTWTG